MRELQEQLVKNYLINHIHTGKTWADQIDIVEITEECTKIKVEYSFDKKPYTLYISFLDLITHVYRMN